MLFENKKCSANCYKFRCGKNAIQIRGKDAWCRWTEEHCNPVNCSFAICVNRRLLPNGICGETLKRKTVEREIDDDLTSTIKVRGKTFRKIGEREIF